MGVTGGGDARRAGVLCMGSTDTLASGAKGGGGDDAGLETHASTTSLSLCASGDEGGGDVPFDFSSRSASPSVPEPLTLCVGDVHGVERDVVSNRDAQEEEEEEVVVVELVDESARTILSFDTVNDILGGVADAEDRKKEWSVCCGARPECPACTA